MISGLSWRPSRPPRYTGFVVRRRRILGPLAPCLLLFGALTASCAMASGQDDEYVGLPIRADAGQGRDGSDGGTTDCRSGLCSDGAADAGSAPDSPPPACDPAKPFGTPVAISEVNTADEDIVSDVSPDGLVIYVMTNHAVVGVHLFFATRPSTTSAFGALQPSRSDFTSLPRSTMPAS